MNPVVVILLGSIVTVAFFSYLLLRDTKRGGSSK